MVSGTVLLNLCFFLRYAIYNLKYFKFFVFWSIKILINIFYLSFIGYTYFLIDQKKLIYLVKCSLYILIS